MICWKSSAGSLQSVQAKRVWVVADASIRGQGLWFLWIDEITHVSVAAGEPDAIEIFTERDGKFTRR